jgi:hypothetical protein
MNEDDLLAIQEASQPFSAEGSTSEVDPSILAASASYIAVPAAMKLAAPRANPGLYVPMALAITFPFNISLGMPLYMMVIMNTN